MELINVGYIIFYELPYLLESLDMHAVCQALFLKVNYFFILFYQIVKGDKKYKKRRGIWIRFYIESMRNAEVNF